MSQKKFIRQQGKNIQGLWKKVVSGWFHRQSMWFILLFLATCGFIVYIWYAYYFMLGTDTARLEEYKKDEQWIDFHEKAFNNILDAVQQREEQRDQILDPQQDIFRIP